MRSHAWRRDYWETQGDVQRREGNLYSKFSKPARRPKKAFIRGYGIQGDIRPDGDGDTQCELSCFGEMLPREENRVTLHPTAKDKWGIPIVQISCEYSANELEMASDQVQQLSHMAEAAGYEVAWRGELTAPGTSADEPYHPYGFRPSHSVSNPLPSWAVPNLFVTDGAAFPSVGFQNPTLTMMAITNRACHYIASELRRGEFAT